ncbi:MAG: potassium channel protein [Planctomycetes bacterium]|nr:potassium channel protein [Planctomycetota bacterium]
MLDKKESLASKKMTQRIMMPIKKTEEFIKSVKQPVKRADEPASIEKSAYKNIYFLDFMKLDIFKALLKVLFIWFIGAIGFYILTIAFANNEMLKSFDFLSAIYEATISLTTVGYSDVINFLEFDEPGRTIGVIYTIVYLIVAYSIVVWASATVISYLVEGTLSEYLSRRKMLKKLLDIKDHYILAGIGSRGAIIAHELFVTNNHFVVIDLNRENILNGLATLPKDEIHFIIGDATDDEVLLAAGVKNAKGLIANLSNDQNNLFITLTAKELNPDMRVITVCDNPKSETKLRKVGADGVIQTNYIGAMRIASEMIRPTVTGFLDKILRDQRGVHRVAEITIPKDSPIANKKLAESDIYRKTGLHIVAYARSQKSEYVFNPGGDLMLNPGGIFIVIGMVHQVEKLHDFVHHGK